MTEEEERNFPHKNVITRALGMNEWIVATRIADESGDRRPLGELHARPRHAELGEQQPGGDRDQREGSNSFSRIRIRSRSCSSF